MENSNKKAKIIIILVILAMLGGIGFFVLRNFIGGATSKLSMQSSGCGYVKYRDLISYVSMSGNVSSSDKVSVTGETDLKVSKLNVKVGDTVKKGDVLCEFDTTQLTEQYNTLKESIEKAKGASDHSHSVNQRNLDDAKKSKDDLVKKAKDAWDQAVEARTKAYEEYNDQVDELNGLITAANDIAKSDDTSDEATARYQDLQARASKLKIENEARYEKLRDFDAAVTAAEEAYKSTVKETDTAVRTAQDVLDAEKYNPSDTASENQLKELEEKLGRCVVKAPKDGVITQLNVSEGSLPASPTIMTIENASQLVIAGKINEADILRINEGMSADVKTSATGDEVISGKVNRIERIISSESGEATNGYTVEIAIDDDDSDLLIGMSASVKIILNKSLNTLSIPYDSVIGGDNDGYFVFVATSRSDGKYDISKRKITKGFEGDYYMEVTSGNLNQGDIVLTNPRGISDGDVISLDLPEE